MSQWPVLNPPKESKDHWLSIQSNTFLDWVNHWLKQRDIEISDISKDFSDGLNLIHLVEVLSGSKVGRYTKNPRFPGQKVDNIRNAISFIENTWGVQCIGLNPMDIMEGNHKQILGLIFLLANKVGSKKAAEEVDGDEDSSEGDDTNVGPTEIQESKPPSDESPVVSSIPISDQSVTEIEKNLQNPEKTEEIQHDTKISTNNETVLLVDKDGGNVVGDLEKGGEEKENSEIVEKLEKKNSEKGVEESEKGVEESEKGVEETEKAFQELVGGSQEVPSLPAILKLDGLSSAQNTGRDTLDDEVIDSPTKMKSQRDRCPSKKKDDGSKTKRAGSTTKRASISGELAITLSKQRRSKKDRPPGERTPSEKKKRTSRSHSTSSIPIPMQEGDTPQSHVSLVLLLKRCEGKETAIIRLQACIRSKKARIARKMKLAKDQFLHLDVIFQEKDKAQKMSRVQAIIRARSCRKKAPNSIKQLRRRYAIASEILSTEESYVHGLHCLTNIYLKDLRTCPSNELPPDLLKDVFGNVEVIFRYNSFLLGMLKKRRANWYKEGARLGDVFVKFVDFLKTYTAFVNCYNKAISGFAELQKIPCAANSIASSRSNPELKGLDVISLLITPIQRLPRYVLLLKDLLHNTPPHHADYDTLSDSVNKMVVVADYVNEKKREAENLGAVGIVAKHVIGFPGDITTNARTYVRQGGLMAMEEPTTVSQLKDLKSNQIRKRFVFLFNDMVLSTKKEFVDKKRLLRTITGVRQEDGALKLEDLETNMDIQFRYCYHVQLEGLEVIDIEHHDQLEHAFALKKLGSEKLMIVFSADSVKSKNEFLHDLDDAIWKRLQAMRSVTLGGMESIDTNNGADIPDMVSRSGLLHKQSHGEWKMKLCTLTGTSFQYLSNDHLAHSKELGLSSPTPLFTIKSNVVLLPSTDTNRPFCFSIGPKKFSALNGTERMAWINDIRSNIRRHLEYIKEKAKEQKDSTSIPQKPTQSLSQSTSSHPIAPTSLDTHKVPLRRESTTGELPVTPKRRPKKEKEKRKQTRSLSVGRTVSAPGLEALYGTTPEGTLTPDNLAEVLDRFQGKEVLVTRLQACIRRKLACRLIVPGQKDKYVDECKDLTTEFSSDKSKFKGIVRLQSSIRAHLLRLQPPSGIKRLRRRYAIVTEILSTEESYVHGLHCLTDIYLKDLQTIDHSVLNPELLKEVFGNVEVIHRYNNFLLGQIRKRMLNWYKEGMRMGDIFVKFVDFLKTYTAFVNSYNKAFTALSELSTIPAARESLIKSRNNPEIKGLDVGSFLITPIQRLPRYVLLLKDLLKNTEESHIDFPSLSDAVTKMVVVADYVNEKKREAENLNAVCVVAQHVIGFPKDELGDLTTISRSYVRQGPLLSWEEPTNPGSLKELKIQQLKRRFVFVFNDMILFTKRETGSILNKITGAKQDENLKLEDLQTDQEILFKYCTSIPLDEVEIVDIEHHESIENGFYLKDIYSENILCVFSAENSKVKSDFLNDVDDAVWKRLQASRSVVLGSSEVPDSNYTTDTVIIKTGLLHKQTRSGDWKVKLCELVGSEFRWYSNDHTNCKDGKPSVSRSLCTLKANISLWPVMDRPFCFVFGVSRGFYYFSAPSGMERLAWINAIRNSIRRHLQQIKDTTPQKQVKDSDKKAPEKTRSLSSLASPKDKPQDAKTVLASIKKGGKGKGLKNITLKKENSKKGLLKDILFKEHDTGKFRKYSAFVKEGRLVLEKDKKEHSSIDLLLVHNIDTQINEVKTKEPGTNLFVFEIVSDKRKDRFGAETKAEVEDWIDRIKEKVDLAKNKKKK